MRMGCLTTAAAEAVVMHSNSRVTRPTPTRWSSMAVHVSSRRMGACVPLRALAYMSSSTYEPPTEATTVFSSRAKFANNCLPWLKTSKIRSTLDKHFHLRELYAGDLSSILEATHRTTEQRVIIKAFPKQKLLDKPTLQHKVKLEWDIHSSLDHPNIIQAYLGMETENSVGLFMEYAGESDAYSYLSAKDRASLREQDARKLVWDVLEALLYLHTQGIVHRDVKSENVFRTSSGKWKLGDFGSALRTIDPRALRAQPINLEGTFSFAAPEYVELWDGGFTREQLLSATSSKLDSWSVGALAFDVLCGRAPFTLYEGISREAEQHHILNCDPVFPSGLSYPAVSFIKQALEKDPQKRPTVRQLMSHEWFEAQVCHDRKRRWATLSGRHV